MLLLESGLADEASAIVAASVIGDGSEKDVAAVLAVFCALERDAASATRLGNARDEAFTLIELDEPPTVMFRTQLALTALVLADVIGGYREISRIRSGILQAAITDAYAARAVIAALGPDAKCLQRVVEAGGLGLGSMPSDLMTQMMTSVADAEARLTMLLGAPEPAAVLR